MSGRKEQLIRFGGAAIGGFLTYLGSELIFENDWTQAFATVVGTIVSAYILAQIPVSKQERAIRALLRGDDYP